MGQAWVAIAGHILRQGHRGSYDGLPMLELLLVTVDVTHPDPADAVISQFADAERLAWMHANFTDQARVPALGGTDSYASRLFDYNHAGRDQLAWVIERLRADRGCRSATITTFQPLTDTTYVPCVSMLDFWLSAEELQLAVYAHSIDFGAKGYGNLVELASLHHEVARQLASPVGTLTMLIKSAHIYDTDLDYMRSVLAAQPNARTDDRSAWGPGH